MPKGAPRIVGVERRCVGGRSRGGDVRGGGCGRRASASAATLVFVVTVGVVVEVEVEVGPGRAVVGWEPEGALMRVPWAVVRRWWGRQGRLGLAPPCEHDSLLSGKRRALYLFRQRQEELRVRLGEDAVLSQTVGLAKSPARRRRARVAGAADRGQRERAGGDMAKVIVAARGCPKPLAGLLVCCNAQTLDRAEAFSPAAAVSGVRFWVGLSCQVQRGGGVPWEFMQRAAPMIC
jgi:hypothetical protein